MLNNYYTLRLIAQDLHQRLAGCTLTQLFTQHRDELVISCASEMPEKTVEHHLVVSCDPARNYIALREEFPRAKRNSVNLFKELQDARLQDVQIHPHDRQLIFQTETPYRIVIQLFGPKANVLLVERNGMIHDAFLKSKAPIGKQLEERKPAATPQSVNELQAFLAASKNDLQAALKRCFPPFGAEPVRELLFLCNLQPDASPTSLTTGEVEQLFEASRQLQELLLEHPSPRIYFDGKRAETFSIIPLKHLERFRCEEYDSIHTAIRTFLGASRKEKGFQEEKKLLVQFLQQLLSKAERTLAKITEEEESRERAAQYETMGKLLMANLTALHKGMKQVELENVFSPSPETITIPLDPALSPAKNAGRYFDKAKKSRHRLEEYGERKEELEERCTAARSILLELEQVDEEAPYKEFIARQRSQLAELGFKLERESTTKREEPLPFRVFTVAGGFQVWAGKSSENNDLLTMKHAKPNDLWFHARGSSGSHVVLKIGSANGNPSKLAIQQAAGIAAYYSKMKNAKLVPVAMTERKYVRKPKGVPAGTVTLEREKTIFAEPKLPES